MEPLNLLLPVVPRINGCDVHARGKVWVAKQGVQPILEFQAMTGSGQPVSFFSMGDSVSDSEATDLRVIARIAEAITGWAGTDRWEVEGDIIDPILGKVRFNLPESIVSKAGVLSINPAIIKNNKPVWADDGLLLVEKSHFVEEPQWRYLGPPTIAEIQRKLIDTIPDNYWWGRVEFTPDQIGQAFIEPIRRWNEMLPPVNAFFSTYTFPWRQQWLDAATGFLLDSAATNYLRTDLEYGAGGVSIADRRKANGYFAKAKDLLVEYSLFCHQRRVSINLQGFFGYV